MRVLLLFGGESLLSAQAHIQSVDVILHALEHHPEALRARDNVGVGSSNLLCSTMIIRDLRKLPVSPFCLHEGFASYKQAVIVDVSIMTPRVMRDMPR
ncbi:MAG: hypothetical protein A2498_00050 [Lentisphaerae bacterium RIFOXYC12_FULL_60_16]|nr:MAG: hypothetical protein A2498_00050 [Lentisphaerae bacterium RIFOXYC12_FULL_60_16]